MAIMTVMMMIMMMIMVMIIFEIIIVHKMTLKTVSLRSITVKSGSDVTGNVEILITAMLNFVVMNVEMMKMEMLLHFATLTVEMLKFILVSLRLARVETVHLLVERGEMKMFEAEKFGKMHLRVTRVMKFRVEMFIIRMGNVLIENLSSQIGSPLVICTPLSVIDPLEETEALLAVQSFLSDADRSVLVGLVLDGQQHKNVKMNMIDAHGITILPRQRI